MPEDASVNVPFIEPGQEDEDEEDDPLMPKRYVNDRGIGVGEMRRSKFVGFTTGILLVGFCIALVVDELEVGRSHDTARSFVRAQRGKSGIDV